MRIAISLLTFAVIAAYAKEIVPNWCYANCHLTPEHWKEEYKVCAGDNQSPIALNRSKTYHAQKREKEAEILPPLGRLQLNATKGKCRAARPIALAYTWEVDESACMGLGESENSTDAAPMVWRIGEEAYVLNHFHFHSPAEHIVEGIRHDMEMHMVHINPKTNAKAVLAVFFDTTASATVRQQNTFLRNFWNKLAIDSKQMYDEYMLELSANETGSNASNTAERATEPSPDESDEEDRSSTNNPYRDLIQKYRLEFSPYFTYSGSLTTPPCTEDVTWFVISRPVPVSRAQVKLFRYALKHNLRTTEGDGHNARPLQSADDRIVRYWSIPDVFSLNGSSVLNPALPPKKDLKRRARRIADEYQRLHPNRSTDVFGPPIIDDLEEARRPDLESARRPDLVEVPKPSKSPRAHRGEQMVDSEHLAAQAQAGESRVMTMLWAVGGVAIVFASVYACGQCLAQLGVIRGSAPSSDWPAASVLWSNASSAPSPYVARSDSPQAVASYGAC